MRDEAIRRRFALSRQANLRGLPAAPCLHHTLRSHLTYKFLSEELYEYLDAAIMVQTSPEEAYRKVNVGNGYIETYSASYIRSHAYTI